MSDRFDACLMPVLKQECPHPENWSDPRNYSNDAHDPGGETMCGIIQAEYVAYRRHKGLPIQDVRKITREEGEEIYRNNYWLPHCPALPPGLDLCFFDEAVNAGPSRAIRILQAALDMPADGQWGPQTALAVRGIFNVDHVVNAYTKARERFYRGLSGYKYFGHGWIRRSEEIGDAALKMVEATS